MRPGRRGKQPDDWGISLFLDRGNISPTSAFLPPLHLCHKEAEGYRLPKGTMMGQVMLYVMTTVKTHIIQA